MGYNLEDACNGCEECVHCGRGLKMYKTFFCDSCGEDYDRDELRRYNHEDICLKCYLEKMTEEWDELPEAQD